MSEHMSVHKCMCLRITAYVCAHIHANILPLHNVVKYKKQGEYLDVFVLSIEWLVLEPANKHNQDESKNIYE
jgi:hypothetical protein